MSLEKCPKCGAWKGDGIHLRPFNPDCEEYKSEVKILRELNAILDRAGATRISSLIGGLE
jgi:hypothetical protein